MTKVLIAVVIVTIVGLVVMQFIDPKSSTSIFNRNDKNTTFYDEDTGSFTIQGYVINPGTYLLSIKDSPTMGDLINAAGGLSSNADDRCFYVTASLTEGETYYVPTKFDANDICGDVTIPKVNVNSDNEEKLQTISGIGAALATSIVDYRSSNGSFYTLEALKKVSGIGNSKFAQIKDYVILHD